MCGPTRLSVPRHSPGGATGGIKRYYNLKTNLNESCIVTQFKVPPFGHAFLYEFRSLLRYLANFADITRGDGTAQVQPINIGPGIYDST